MSHAGVPHASTTQAGAPQAGAVADQADGQRQAPGRTAADAGPARQSQSQPEQPSLEASVEPETAGVAEAVGTDVPASSAAVPGVGTPAGVEAGQATLHEVGSAAPATADRHGAVPPADTALPAPGTQAATSGKADTAAPRTGPPTPPTGLAALRGPVPNPVLDAVLDALDQNTDLREFLNDPAHLQTLAHRPELSALIAAQPDIAEELSVYPDRADAYSFDRYLNTPPGPAWNFEKDFANYLHSLYLPLTGTPYKLVKDTVNTLWDTANNQRRQAEETDRAERDQRLARFQPHLSDTWQHSERIIYTNNLHEASFTAAQHKILTALAAGSSRPRETPTAHTALHARLDGGSGGVSIAYLLAEDAKVDLLVYARSTSRIGNSYQWHGHGTQPIAGPLPLAAAEHTPELTTSRTLLTTRQTTNNTNTTRPGPTTRPGRTDPSDRPAGLYGRGPTTPTTSDNDNTTTPGAGPSTTPNPPNHRPPTTQPDTNPNPNPDPDPESESESESTLPPDTQRMLASLEKLHPDHYTHLITEASGIAQAHGIPMPPVIGNDPTDQNQRNHQHEHLIHIAHTHHHHGPQAATALANTLAATTTQLTSPDKTNRQTPHPALPGGMPPNRHRGTTAGGRSGPPAAAFLRGGRVAGRDFTLPQPEAGVEVAAETRSAVHSVLPGHPDAVARRMEEYRPGLWGAGSAPYLVRADHDPAGQRVRVHPAGPDSAVWLDYPGFAQLLATDQHLTMLDSEAPVLLVIPDAARRNLDLLRAINDTTRRRVWAHTRTPSLRPYTTGGPLHLGVDFLAMAPEGQWLYNDPHPTGQYGPAPRPGNVTTLDNRTYSDTDLLLTPMADTSGRVIGHWSHADRDQVACGLPYFSATEVYSHLRSGEFRAGVGPLRPVPWPTGPGSYFLDTHGGSGGVELQTVGGSAVPVGARHLAGLLQRRRSRELLFPTAPVVLISCSTGADTRGNGLLHQVADRLNVPVYGPSTTVDIGPWTAKRQPLNLEPGGVWRWALPGRPSLHDDGPAPADEELRHPAERRDPRLAPPPGTRPLPAFDQLTRPFQRGRLVVGLTFGQPLEGNQLFDALSTYDLVPTTTNGQPTDATKLMPAPWHTQPDEPPFLVHALPHPDHTSHITATIKTSGEVIALNAREFARLLAESPLHEQPAHVPVILVVPGTTDPVILGQEVANATGRRVWTHPAPTPTPHATGFLRLGIHTHPGQPPSPWTRTDPTPVEPEHPQASNTHAPGIPSIE
ncbi:hypothetical protein [Streptomyces sp. NPDC056707]|uniref:hypothetical protein n=1 Tax=Streptomyces sp. NPDC056707 TaxID=3345919 RepID=UPI0036C0E400